MTRRYVDTAFVVKCCVFEVGSESVRALASDTDELITSALARAEFAAAVRRKRRENALTQPEADAIAAQFAADCADGIWTFIPINDVVLQRVSVAFASLRTSTALRAADAIHCASAVECGANHIYSNDRHLLGAASDFKLLGIDVTAT